LAGSDADGPPQGGITLIGGDGRTNRVFGRSLDPDGNVQTAQLFVQSDGKVIGVAGATLFRYNSDGTTDTSFDNDGVIWIGGDASVSGRDGKDTILGESGRDSLWGNAGRDSIFGGSGSDRVAGNGGRDHLYGGGGNDRIFGGASGDWLYGQGGSDQLFGGGG